MKTKPTPANLTPKSSIPLPHRPLPGAVGLPAPAAPLTHTVASGAPQSHSIASEPAPCRPASYHPGMAEDLAAVIRERGLSDTGAARLLGISPGAISRWKREHEELAPLLAAAREEFRLAQLDIILAAASTRSGWRAAAWLLERVFPEDYSPRAAERQRFQELAEASHSTHPAETEPDPMPAPAPVAPQSAPSAPTCSPGAVFQNSQNSVGAPIPFSSVVADATKRSPVGAMERRGSSIPLL